MIRVAISVEGPTEEEFSKGVLATHLRSHGIEAQPILLGRARGRSPGGGNVSVGRLASEMVYLCRSFDVVTSLVDFYGFRDKGDNTAEELETLVRREVEQKIDWSRNRVLPYVQRHEFEGLLFSDVGAFSVLGDAPVESVDLLRNIRAGFETPEDINDNQATAPSRRIKKAIPHYHKLLHGPLVAAEIGLGAIRAECPGFDAWITSLESLPSRIRSADRGGMASSDGLFTG